MTEAKEHTPGPWRERINDSGSVLGIYSSNKESGIGDMICYMTNPVPGNHEGKANARLIASAPALLKIVDGFLNTLLTENLEWEAIIKRYFNCHIELFNFAMDTYQAITDQDIADNEGVTA
jgi:hypothetical protein